MERVLQGGEPHVGLWLTLVCLFALLVGFDPEQLTRIRIRVFCLEGLT